MLKALLLKEFVKLRAFWIVALVFNMCMLGYVYITMNGLFRLDHAEVVWYRVIHLGQLYYSSLTYVPALTGLFMAAVQFFPEMRNQRFRISLHLPIAPHLIVMGHVFVGFLAVAVILLIDLAGLGLMTHTRFPGEVVARALTTAAPWMLAGLSTYLGATLVLLEPTWKIRMLNFAVAAGMTGLFLRGGVPGAYGPILPILCAALLIYTPSVLLPAYRFRYRRV